MKMRILFEQHRLALCSFVFFSKHTCSISWSKINGAI